MRGAIRPVALSARAVLRSRPLGHHSHNPFQPRLLQSNTLHPRAFWTSSPTWRAAAAAEAEAPGPVHEQEEGRETRPRDRDNAQKQVDDRPWHREGSHSQPESTVRDPAGHDQTKGRLLTTPTRLLKLILPMPFHPEQQHINPDKDNTTETHQELGTEKVDPLALLVHPQQPLSYLERLIQAEIPPLLAGNREKLPDIVFRAEADQEEKRNQKSASRDNVAQYSGLGREGPDKKSSVDWVRWSGSTEVGDFIRDAARGREFAINIEGYPQELRVAVPSFKDRTYYMRLRLRRMSREIDHMSKLKNECDNIAHKGAHRIAQGGFAALAGWWGVVYYVTFHTEMGWDLVEPVTYLAGLSTIMGGYLWFLYMSKDLSYKAAMNITVSRRQNALYQERGFDLGTWEHHVHEANALRRDIKMVANEYDVEWNETKDLGGEEIKEVLESEKSKKSDGDEDKKDKSKEKQAPKEKKG